MRIKSSSNSLPGYFEKYGYTNVSKERLELELNRYRRLGKDQKTLDFITKFLLVYGLDDPKRQISFENTEYVNSYSKIFFTCKRHGIASGYPFRMLVQGTKCGKCGHEFKRRLSSEESYLKNFDFTIDKALKMAEKIGFTRISCQEFSELLEHYETVGLSRATLRFLALYILRFGANPQFSFDKSEYKGNYKPMTVTCLKHGDFSINPSALYRNGNCPKCFYESLRHPYESFKKHRDFEYDDEWNLAHWHGVYYSKIRVKCRLHGWFEQSASKHFLRNHGCALCAESRMERDLSDKLASLGFKLGEDFVREKTFPGFVSDLGHAFRFDFYFPKVNVLVELDGILHFELRNQREDDFRRRKQADKIKTKFANDNDIRLIRIKFDQFSYWLNSLTVNSIASGSFC